MLKHRNEKMVPISQVNEMMALYTAWIAALFRRLGEGEYRISVKEIREGLGETEFSAVKVGDEYVITLKKKAETEVTHVGDEA